MQRKREIMKIYDCSHPDPKSSTIGTLRNADSGRSFQMRISGSPVCTTIACVLLNVSVKTIERYLQPDVTTVPKLKVKTLFILSASGNR